MNKKLLFVAMSLAALTACTNNDDFGSNNVAEETSPVKIEVMNFNEGGTRASMNGNTIKWSAKDGDLFTLYHGGEVDAYLGYQNATFTASEGEGKAALSTPSMILKGEALMIWPVDTSFTIKSTDNLSISIPDVQTDIANQIPYVSDRFTIGDYDGHMEHNNTAGKDRIYNVYMRPMASQLILKADYVGMDDIKALEAGEDGIDPIKLTSVDLLTKDPGDQGATPFTVTVPVKWNGVNPDWPTPTTANPHTWSAITYLDIDNIAAAGKTAKLTAKEKCLDGNDGCKFLILPQATITTGVDEAGIVVNTIYGKVVIAATGLYDTKYTDEEYKAAWYRYVSEAKAATDEENASTPATGDFAGKHLVVAKTPALGMQQTINTFSTYRATSGTVKGEYMGVASTRYVKVLLNHLDMSDLHIKTDKQLRDVVRVWNELGLDDVTVILDGDATNKEFEMSQKTIETINTINAASTNKFEVKPCIVDGEKCETIVITGGGDVQDLTFITKNVSNKAKVAFNAGETWKWNGDVKVKGAQLKGFINRGTMQNAEGATLRVMSSNGTYQQFDVPFVNDGTWNITAGILRVQFNVTNNGTVNISKGAEYRQDGQSVQAKKTTFTNDATDKPSRFGGDDTKIGVVNNSGVFANIGGAEINNYGLIEHKDVDAKTYITTNQTTGADFGTAFGATNKMGRINLPFSNKNENNISISAELTDGFVSVTVDGDAVDKDGKPTNILDASVVGDKVNYIIVNSGIKTISDVSANIKYVEIADKSNSEIAWEVTGATTYDGLMVLSNVNITIGTTITVSEASYLGSEAQMYVGGTFTNTGGWNGYYGDTSTTAATNYVTY